MARLFQVTEESIDTLVHTTPLVKLYGAYHVVTATEIDSKANLILTGRTPEGTPTERVVSDTLATTLSAMNGAQEDARALNLSVVDDFETPDVNFTAYNKLFNISDIVEVFADPNNAAQSVIISNEYRKSRGVQLIVNETVANILTAANA